MDSEAMLFNKEGFIFVRVTNNHYKLSFTIENKNIVISQIIDFNLIKLIYDLNQDVYKKFTIEKLNDNEVVVTLLMKHFFEDIGLPQRFSFIRMFKFVEDRKIIFKSQSIKTHIPIEIPKEAELIAIQDLTCLCNIITPHKIDFYVDVIFESYTNIPLFAEKMIGTILHKIFKRVKQFIENVRL
jgi:hypothetical protein